MYKETHESKLSTMVLTNIIAEVEAGVVGLDSEGRYERKPSLTSMSSISSL